MRQRVRWTTAISMLLHEQGAGSRVQGQESRIQGPGTCTQKNRHRDGSGHRQSHEHRHRHRHFVIGCRIKGATGPKDHRYFRVFRQAQSRSPTQRLGLKNIRDNGSDGQPLFLCFYTNRVQGPGSRAKNPGSRVQGHAQKQTQTPRR